MHFLVTEISEMNTSTLSKGMECLAAAPNCQAYLNMYCQSSRKKMDLVARWRKVLDKMRLAYIEARQPARAEEEVFCRNDALVDALSAITMATIGKTSSPLLVRLTSRPDGFPS